MGSFSVLNNIPSVNGQNQLTVNNLNLARTLNRLASGKRINSGADDAAGLQIADSLRGNVLALNQSARNAADGISVLQIADGALQQITNLLHRASTLATQSSTDTQSISGKRALGQELDYILKEISRIAASTNFNGQQLLVSNGTASTVPTPGVVQGFSSAEGAKNGATDIPSGLSGTFSVFVGDMTNSFFGNKPAEEGKNAVSVNRDINTISVSFGAVINSYDQGANYSNVTGEAGKGLNIGGLQKQVDILLGLAKADADGNRATLVDGANNGGYTKAASAQTTQDLGEAAQKFLSSLGTALTQVATMRGDIGAGMNRLEAAVNVIRIQSQNTLAAESAIRDADMAAEISDLTKFQILAQTGIAALAQANSNSQTILGLLR